MTVLCNFFITFCLLGNFVCFLSSAEFFSKSTFSKNQFSGIQSVSNS